MNYSFISDKIVNPGVRAVFSHNGLDVTLHRVEPFKRIADAFRPENPDILGIMSPAIVERLVQEIADYLTEEHGVRE